MSQSGPQHFSPPKPWRALWTALVVLLAVLTIVLWNWNTLQTREQRDSQQRFELDVQTLGQTLEAGMKGHEVVLRGIASAFAGADPQVSYRQWIEIFEQMRMQELYPSISAIAWARYLRPHQLDDYVARMRADERPDFHIFPQESQEDHLPIEYIAPLDRSYIVGLNLLSRHPQSQFIRQAIDSGQTILSTALSDLYSPTLDGNPQIGALMYFPIYVSGVPPDTVQERRATFVGLTDIAFRGQELVKDMFDAQLHLFYINARDLEADTLLFDSRLVRAPTAATNWQPQFHGSLDLPLYGRTWRLEVTGTPEYERGLAVGSSNTFGLLLGVVTSVALALLAGTGLYQRDRKLYASEQVATRLREQADQLLQANRYKSEFLANMSHELRTPLNSILILSDQLRQNVAGNLSDKQTRHADIVYRAGSDLLQLINDVLDLAKIEAGHMPINLEALALQDVLIDIDAAMRPLAEAKGLHLYIPPISSSSSVPQHVYTDRVRLHQILRNLLSNAIKFTDQGQVRLTFSANRTLEDGRTLISITVQDTGIGIDPAHHEQIFQEFAQLDGSTRRRFGGTGLGLPITRQLVQALEGDITLTSALGQGSTFIVRLPMQGVEHGTPAVTRIGSPADSTSTVSPDTVVTPSPTAAVPPHPPGRRLLLVDDDIRNVYAMTALLDNFGLEISTASNGQEAIDTYQAESPDLILMDMSMPVMDGYTATRLLKTEHGCTIPIIALTAHAMKGDREKCLAAGADDYLSKPVTRERLQTVLERWLVNYSQRKEAES